MRKSILSVIVSALLAMAALLSAPTMATGYDLVADPVYDTAMTASKDISASPFTEPAVDDSDALGAGLISGKCGGGFAKPAYFMLASGYPDDPVPAVMPAPVAIASKVPI